MPIGGLAADVSRDQVQGLLLARAPGILDTETDESLLFDQTVRGITTEVVPLVGADVAAGPRRDLAVWAITLGVAAQIEAALFPEQQGPGDLGRAAYLDGRYQAALAQLRGWTDNTGTGDSDGVPSPIGCFPPAPVYPDPACAYPSRVVIWP